MTTSEIAEIFGIHPNVARHHLDKLAVDGYLAVSMQRRSGRRGPGAGRPAKCYEASDKSIDLHFPSRRQHILIELLLRLIERIGEEDVALVAQEVGREYGRELAQQIGEPTTAGYEAAVRAVAQAMTGIGFQMSTTLDPRTVLTRQCPFGEAAADHPEVVCSLDRGIVIGLMDSLDPRIRPVLNPHQEKSGSCGTEVPLTISSNR